ncbi:PilW family protein [Propionivibrio sp.]|uniref:PilW family protein n=1 Tax=Propionivibrio sp. TaxID=2212460 RepID=UPI00272DDA50|nr:PilW family protein [Propionivibrio sp.]
MIKLPPRRFTRSQLAGRSSPAFLAAQCGLTLVELMVAIALGLLVLAALTALFVNTSANRREIDRAAGILENGRYALSVLRDDLALAGYYGTLATPAGTVATTSCSNSVADWSDSLTFHVRGSNQNDTNLDACFSGTTLPPRKADSDAIVIYRASTCVSGPTAETGCDPKTSSASEAYIQVSECGSEYVTTPFVLDLGSAATFATLKKRLAGGIACDVNGTAPIRRFYKSLYYVDTSNNLVRADMVAAAVAGTPAYTVTTLADGIENIQFQYGFDTNNDGTADEFHQSPGACSTACTWSDAMGVRIWILVRAPTATPGYSNDKELVMDDYSVTPSDSFKRHVFSSYIGFVNSSGRRFK